MNGLGIRQKGGEGQGRQRGGGGGRRAVVGIEAFAGKWRGKGDKEARELSFER